MIFSSYCLVITGCVVAGGIYGAYCGFNNYLKTKEDVKDVAIAKYKFVDHTVMPIIFGMLAGYAVGVTSLISLPVYIYMKCVG